METSDPHDPENFWVCTSFKCDREHLGHPGQGHCGSCLDEDNEGYYYGDYTFKDNKPKCCCRDKREHINGC